MRIAYFVDCFPLVSETFILSQLAGMIDRGHEVTVFTNELSDRDVVHPVVERHQMMDRVVVRPSVSKNHLSRLGQAIKAFAGGISAGQPGRALSTLNVLRWGREALGLHLLVRAGVHFGRGEFDVLHCQFGQLGIEVADLRSCGILQGTLVTSFRGADATRNVRAKPERFQALFATGDRFLAVSESIKEQLVKFGCPAEKIEILRSGIDLSRFGYQEHGELHSPLRLVTIGRLGPTKGQEFALEAVRKLVDSGLSVEYRIVGDGQRRQELTERVDSLGLESIVTFEGAVDSDRVVEILRSTDILIAPSIVADTGQTEGVPNVLKEAMASGVPVIGTMVGGVAELIEHKKNGFLVPQKDADAIAASVQAIVAMQDTLPQMLSSARESIERDYDVHQLNDDLDKVYASLSRVA